MAAATRLGEELDRSSREGDALVILELDGDRGRSDATLAIAEAVRACPVPVAVFLSDARDRRVGAAQLCIGVAARDCVVEPGTTVRASPGDDRRDLSPEKPYWERVSRELSGLLYARLREAGAPADLSQVLAGLPHDAKPDQAWVISPPDTSGEIRVVFEDPGRIDPPAAAWRLVERAPDGSPLLLLNADRLRSLHAVRGTASSTSGVLGALGVKGRVNPTVTIDATLDLPRRQVEADLTSTDDLLRRAGEDLDLPKPPRADVSGDAYRKAARSARQRLTAVTNLLDRTEALLEQYPELARTAAPGQTEVAGKPSVYAARWRSTIQTRRDQAKKLDAKCAGFESPERQ